MEKDKAPEGPVFQTLRRLNKDGRILRITEPLVGVAQRALDRLGKVIPRDPREGRDESRDVA